MAEAGQHVVSNILLDQKSIKGVRFSIKKIFWAGFDFYDTLEERVYGEVVATEAEFVARSDRYLDVLLAGLLARGDSP